MSAQVQLLGQDELKEGMRGIDASGACPDLSTLESVTRRGLDEIKDSISDSISELNGTCSTIEDGVHKLMTTTGDGFGAVVDAIKRLNTRPLVPDR